MKIEKNFTTGILSGIFGVLLLLVLTGTTKKEITTITPMYEFHDLEDTRGLIFNKVTGEIKYEELREKPLTNIQDMRIQHSGEIKLWNGEYYRFD